MHAQHLAPVLLRLVVVEGKESGADFVATHKVNSNARGTTSPTTTTALRPTLRPICRHDSKERLAGFDLALSRLDMPGLHFVGLATVVISNEGLVRVGPRLGSANLPAKCDMDGIETREASPSQRTSLDTVEEEDDEEDALPPRRTFQSLTDMYRDEGRETRMGEQLSLLQYLEYDAMGILVQIMDMADDQNFHRFVWQHTSLDVMDTVTSYLAERLAVAALDRGERAGRQGHPRGRQGRPALRPARAARRQPPLHLPPL